MYIHTSAVYQQSIIFGAQENSAFTGMTKQKRTRGHSGSIFIFWQIPFLPHLLTKRRACIQSVARGSPASAEPHFSKQNATVFRRRFAACRRPSQMRRGRPRKPRLTRMDAAVDAMAPLGFTEKQVKEAVKGLIEVYDGNDAWPVIEEASYTLLIEVMLNDVAINQEQGTEVANNSKDNCLEEGTSGLASNSVLPDIQQHEEREEDAPNPSDIVVADPAPPVEIGASSRIIINEGGAEVLPTETMENVSCKTTRDSETGLQHKVKRSSSIPSLPATDTHPPRRFWPCYGWIDSDEDEEPNDFIYLDPA